MVKKLENFVWLKIFLINNKSLKFHRLLIRMIETQHEMNNQVGYNLANLQTLKSSKIQFSDTSYRYKLIDKFQVFIAL